MDDVPKHAVKCGKCNRIVGLAIAKATECCPYCGESISKAEEIKAAEMASDTKTYWRQ